MQLLIRFPTILIAAAACSLGAIALAGQPSERGAAAAPAASTASPLASSVTEPLPRGTERVPASATDPTPSPTREAAAETPTARPAVSEAGSRIAGVLPSGIGPSEAGWFVASVEAALLADLNAARTGAGLTPLARDETLDDVARARAEDLVRRGYFSHVSPDGGTAFTELQSRGIRYGLAGENLARNTYPESNAARVAVEGWLASPGHRRNVLEPRFARVGLAATRVNATWVIVAVFTD